MSDSATEEDTAGSRILVQLNQFASASVARSSWQVVSTLTALACTLTAVRFLSPSPARFLLVPLVSGLLIRVFVLQHDAGHHSLFRGRRANDVMGTWLSFVTGIPYEPWRTEHNWHHTHQAQLDVRGIDRVNSPMTLDEAREKPEDAKLRKRLIRVWSVALLGVWSLTLKRKALRGFFHFRDGFRWRIVNPGAQVRGLRTTIAGHIAVNVGVALFLGAVDWAAVVVPAYFLGACGGALLFWIQHNFDGTYHARSGDWSYWKTGVRGSSYLSLPFPLSWFTAHIGVHHIHHLHPRVPNYRLEEAREAIAELRAVPPLDFEGFKRGFTHVFWDEANHRMVRFEDIGQIDDPGEAVQGTRSTTHVAS